ncbi:MAG TPA: Zn-dependent hydrolase, partial [Myxococcaceae bacterium]|nr:Zn-dependent hydrolase [Myxococcaceae bacterium]
MEPRINGQRLWESLMRLGEVGAYRDERSGLVGVNRLALTQADGEGRALVKKWFEEAGLEVRVDQIGNCYGRRKGKRDDAPVMAGSHIDSVPTAGRFDGCLGVLGALEAIRILNEKGIQTGRPLEIAFFTDEEGCRFGTDMLGSAVAVGRLGLEQALALKDRDGLVVADELKKIGFAGHHPVKLSAPHAYVECHIEQGPILRAANVDLGVVTGVQAISWQEVTIVGKSAHAGTTPMELRKDAGLAAARINVQLHRMAVSGDYGEMRATMGAIDPVPDMVNIVPGRVRCTVDLRNPDDAAMTHAETALGSFLGTLEVEMGVQIQSRRTAKTPRIHFSHDVQAVLARMMDEA